MYNSQENSNEFSFSYELQAESLKLYRKEILSFVFSSIFSIRLIIFTELWETVFEIIETRNLFGTFDIKFEMVTFMIT